MLKFSDKLMVDKDSIAAIWHTPAKEGKEEYVQIRLKDGKNIQEYIPRADWVRVRTFLC